MYKHDDVDSNCISQITFNKNWQIVTSIDGYYLLISFKFAYLPIHAFYAISNIWKEKKKNDEMSRSGQYVYDVLFYMINK